jgi:hypothetical protein
MRRSLRWPLHRGSSRKKVHVAVLGVLFEAGCDAPLDLGNNAADCTDPTMNCATFDGAVADSGVDVQGPDDALEVGAGVDVPLVVDVSSMPIDVPVSCAASMSTRCGSELLADWRVRPSCGATFGARSFSSTPGKTTLTSCTDAVDLVGSESNAELPLPTVGGLCRPSGLITVTTVGRLLTNNQSGLGFVLNGCGSFPAPLGRGQAPPLRRSAFVGAGLVPARYAPQKSRTRSQLGFGRVHHHEPLGLELRARIRHGCAGLDQRGLAREPAKSKRRFGWSGPRRSAVGLVPRQRHGVVEDDGDDRRCG